MGGLGRYNQNEASQSSVFHNSKQLNSNRNICSVFISLKSVSSMPSHCCVPECTQRGYQSNDGGKVSFFNFPKALIKRKQWIHAIRRDEGKEFQINEKTKVCSLHFKSTDLKKSLNGRIHPLPDAVPSKFKWKDSPKKRKPPKERIPLSKPATPSTTTTQVQVEVETSTTAPVTVQEELNAALERVKVLEQHLFNIQNELLQSQKSAEMLENKNQALKKTTADLTSENALLSSKLFNVDRFTKDEDVAFYTGFPSRDAFSSILEFLNPGTNCENIRSREKNDTEVPDDFYEDEFEPQVNVKARQRKIKPEDQFFLVMCRLRRGFSVQHLAHLYGVSQSTISRIFIPWINFLYLKLGQICIWPSREVVSSTMPSEFKEKYPTTRVIIDCTEVRCEMPSSLLLNSELFSSYKNHVTLKALVGISPGGAITFISQLYTGSISDREIVMRSGLLSQQFDDNDSVMADKGFQIQDLLPLGVSLNIPPFLGGDSQMSEEDVVKTQQIASLRIHVERAINKIKNYHIWDTVIPLSAFGVVNQMWSVCAFMCNIQNPLISE